MRYGEFGSQTPTNLEVFQREIPPASQWPLEDINDPVLVRKNVVQAAFNPLDWLYKPVIEGYFGPLDNPEQLIAAGQYVGAESLRYAVDELRRKGRKVGGLTTWDFNEPWPNGAGSYLVDYDGRPLMNYSFMQQALSPVSLTLRYQSNLYEPSSGLKPDLWLASDAPATVEGVHWSWTARDRRGRLLGQDSGTAASINPGEAYELRKLDIKLLPESALGPVVVELRAQDAQGRTLSERAHVFGTLNTTAWPFDGLLRNGLPDPDDQTVQPQKTIRVLWIQDGPGGALDDTAWYLRRFGVEVTYCRATAADFEKVASTADALVHDFDAIWIGAGDPLKLTPVGERLGAHSLANIAAAVARGMGIAFEGGWNSFTAAGFAGTALEDVVPAQEARADSVERQGPTKVSTADPQHAVTAGRFAATFPELGGYLKVKPKEGTHLLLQSSTGDAVLFSGQHGKGRVLAFASGVSTNWFAYGGNGIDWAWNLRAWSGQPIFLARMLSWLANAPDQVVRAIDIPDSAHRTVLPVRRTTIRLAGNPRFETTRAGERMSFQLENAGGMTALFCTPHSVLEYRTDTTITNDFVSVPPGQSRLMTIEAVARPDTLGLQEVGWQISCWNADTVEISPSANVLLSFGRADGMTREFAGPAARATTLTFSGSRPESARVPWILPLPTQGNGNASRDSLTFTFEVSAQQAARSSLLNIRTADQAANEATVIEVEANGHHYSRELPRGLGKQLEDPAHLAFPHTVGIELPAGTWRSGANSLKISVKPGGWFTWDSLDLSLNRRTRYLAAQVAAAP